MASYSSVVALVDQVKRDAAVARGRYQEVEYALDKANAEAAELQITAADNAEAHKFLTSLADKELDRAIHQIEAIVTRGLIAVFGQGMSFRVVQSTKASMLNLDFMIVSRMGDQLVETPVIGSRGGGVAAVVGFLLRVVILLLRPELRRTLLLDETFAQLSAGYEPRLADFLRELCDKADLQLILVTHSDAYTDVADITYKVALREGKTLVTATR